MVTDTSVGDVRGEEGRYHYRQYDAVELAERRSLRGRLVPPAPRPPARCRRVGRVRAELGRLRVSPTTSPPSSPPSPPAGGPLLDQLRSALSLAGASRGCRPLLDLGPEKRRGRRRGTGRARPGAGGPAVASRPRPAGRDRSRSATTHTMASHAGHYLGMVHGRRDAARRRRRSGARALPDRHDRPRLQRLHVHRPGGRVDGRRRSRLPGRRAGCAVRPAARGSPQPRTGAGRRGHGRRRSGAGGVGRRAAPGAGRQAHGLRACGVPGRRPALGPVAPHGARAGRGPGRPRPRRSRPRSCRPSTDLKPGRTIRPNVELYAGVVMERCGLPRRAVHAHLRGQPGRRLGCARARAGRGGPADPARCPLRRALAPRSGPDHADGGASRLTVEWPAMPASTVSPLLEHGRGARPAGGRADVALVPVPRPGGGRQGRRHAGHRGRSGGRALPAPRADRSLPRRRHRRARRKPSGRAAPAGAG